MPNFLQQLIVTLNALQINMPIAAELIGLLWVIHIVNWILGYRLNIFGIYPRHPFGLIGIFTSPFLHGHFDHLFFNSIPLFILACFVLLNGVHPFLVTSWIIILLSGSCIWLFGRKALHIGASSLIMGYLGYCLMSAYYHATMASVGVALVCLYYFGSMLFSVLPSDVKVSWEGHLFGLLAGIAAIFIAPLFF